MIEARPLPPRLDTSGFVSTVPFTLRVLRRAKDVLRRIISDETEALKPRKTTTEDPFSYDAACKDIDCFVRYCDKHALNRAAVLYTEMLKKFLKKVMAMATEFRKINNHVALRSHSWRQERPHSWRQGRERTRTVSCSGSRDSRRGSADQL